MLNNKQRPLAQICPQNGADQHRDTVLHMTKEIKKKNTIMSLNAVYFQ